MPQLEFDPDITAEQFLALPQAVRAEYVRRDRQRMLDKGWTPYWSEQAGCDAWLPPAGAN